MKELTPKGSRLSLEARLIGGLTLGAAGVVLTTYGLVNAQLDIYPGLALSSFGLWVLGGYFMAKDALSPHPELHDQGYDAPPLTHPNLT